MHVINITNAAPVEAWCAVITLILVIFGLWSKRQDHAIKRVEDKLAAEQRSRYALIRYVWQLLHILDKNSIDYPPPPSALYEPFPTINDPSPKDPEE